MEKRRRRRYVEEDVQLEDMLQPYEEGPAEESFWQEKFAPEETQYDQMYVDQPYLEEYSDEREEADLESRVHIAMGVLDLISIVIGIAVILVLVAMFVSLFSWLRNDILNSAVLMQSGLK